MKLIFIIFPLSMIHFSGSTDMKMKNPIIMIPGVGGSQIEVKMDDTTDVPKWCRVNSKDYFAMWINTMYCLTHTPACIYQVLRLNYDKIKRVTSNRRGIETHIPGFGATDKSGYLDTTTFMTPYFNALVKRMVKEGYIPGLSIRAAPYDFRKGPREHMEYCTLLEQLIENTYVQNGEQKIILIVHSLGGLLTMMFLQRQSQEWKDQYIESLITLSVGWAGSVKAIEAYMKGFSLRVAEFKPKCSFSDKPLLEQTQEYIRLPKLNLVPSSLLRTMPSIIWLFPSKKAWKKTDVLVRSRTPEEKFYTLKNMKEFFTDLGDKNGWEMYKDVLTFQRKVSDPGVKLHCLYGTNVDTIALVDHSTSIWDILNFPIMENGDGLVNLQSLQVCEQWSLVTTRVKTRSFWGVSHLGILSNSKVLNHIAYLVNKN